MPSGRIPAVATRELLGARESFVIRIPLRWPSSIMGTRARARHTIAIRQCQDRARGVFVGLNVRDELRPIDLLVDLNRLASEADEGLDDKEETCANEDCANGKHGYE